MRPKLSLAGLNSLRMAIALLAGGMAFGISLLGRSTSNASALVDGTLLTTLWIYIGVTAVPWANLKGMAGAGVTPALTMAGFGVYLGAATAFSGWTVAENTAWREEPRAAPTPRCVPAPEAAPDARDAGVANRPPPPAPAAAPPAPSQVLPTPLAAPAPTAAAPAAAAPAPAPADPGVSAREASPSDASVGEPEGRRRRSRRRRDEEDDPEPDDSRPPPAVVLERDPVGTSAPNN